MKRMNDDLTKTEVAELFAVVAYDKQRTAAFRAVDRDVDMLALALHAIRDGSLAVADEYVERVLASITTVRNDLRLAPDTQ